MTRLPAYAIAAIVLLRLLTGWHFYNEGVKKLDGSFSSAGFLRTAKGPFAPLFRSMVKGPYGAHVDLARPVEIGTRPEEQQAAIDSWTIDYGKRARQAIKDGNPLPNDIDSAVPGSEWVGNIASSWDEGLQRLGRLGVDEDLAAELGSIRDAKLGEVVNYLHGVAAEIDDLQHEEWRLHELREESGLGSPAPFQHERIEAKANEVWATMQPWIASVKVIEDDFVNEVSHAVDEAGISGNRVESALAERSMLGWIDFLVTCVVLGSGICVFLGLFTRVAALLAAGFLLSLIMTQPPWVVGADLNAFFNWSIELAAFLVLAAIGAGQWAGLDGLFLRLRNRFGDLSPKYQNTPAKPASAS